MTYQDFETYLRETEPDKRARGENWAVAIGLQAVDGLKPSDYLLDTARRNIEGEITLAEAGKLIDSYYESKTTRAETNDRTEEADKVSHRIAEILAEPTFNFTPLHYVEIHRRLFAGIYSHAGRIRDYNITKREWVLDGATVLYSSAELIGQTLAYDFNEERNFSYDGLPLHDAIRHLAKFIANLWQIHAFGEGNTRTTAVFTIKYLRSFGWDIANDAFRDNAWYFRNALVRANYNNLPAGITATSVYLEHFFENLLFGSQHELKNRFLHIRYQDPEPSQSITKVSPKYQNDTLDKCSLAEAAIVRLIKDNPRMTQAEIARRIGKSSATIKRMTIALQEREIIFRVGGKRNGEWRVK